MKLTILGLPALVFALVAPAPAQDDPTPALRPVELAEKRAARVKAMVADSISSYRLTAGPDGRSVTAARSG